MRRNNLAIILIVVLAAMSLIGCGDKSKTAQKQEKPGVTAIRAYAGALTAMIQEDPTEN